MFPLFAKTRSTHFANLPDDSLTTKPYTQCDIMQEAENSNAKSKHLKAMFVSFICRAHVFSQKSESKVRIGAISTNLERKGAIQS